MGNKIPVNLREIARLQAGVITRRQALRAGLSASLSPGAIKWQLTRGGWRQLYPGVYVTFSGPVGRDAHLWAVVLYAGRGAQLSHETAAEQNGLTERRCPLIHATIPSRRVRQARGVVIHRSAHLDWDARFPPGIVPHTFVEETVVDLVNAAESLVLPPALAGRLDLGRLAPAPGSFVDEALTWRHSDVLFTAPLLDGRDAFVYVLVEHQSSDDPLMASRVLRYVTRIWDACEREHPGARRLPAVIPLVVYQGPGRWASPVQLLDVIDLDPGDKRVTREPARLAVVRLGQEDAKGVF